MREDFRFNLPEIAGALGDYGTILPIAIGAAIVTESDISHIFFFFALSYILTGLYYRLPIPVEPMKAIGVLAIAGTLTSAEIASAGLFMGIILFLVAVTGAIDSIKRQVPTSIIRGIQLGLALTLMHESFHFLATDWQLGAISILLILFFTLSPILNISALVVFILGLSVGIVEHGPPPVTLLSWPTFIHVSFADLGAGLLKGVLPQLPLTLGNAVLATSLLIKDLFHREVPEKKLMLSMSFMCLLSSPFGGFPMCHGAGGLAAQYRFGARTGGSNLVSGILLLLVALFFATPHLVKVFPLGVLGALLFFSGLALLKSALKTENNFFTIMTGLLAVWAGLAVAFGSMLLLHKVVTYFAKKREQASL